MATVTIRILDGAGVGRVYSRLKSPITIGREDENSIQLVDDQVSRCHAKIQDHNGRVIITDLTSTNGTRVNGHLIQMRILQVGDVIAIGRCVLLYAAKEGPEVKAQADDPDPFRTAYIRGGATVDDDSKHWDIAEPAPAPDHIAPDLFPNGPPELPTDLNGLQQVQLSDILSFLHERVGVVVRKGEQETDSGQRRSIRLDWETWSKLVALNSDLAEYLGTINANER